MEAELTIKESSKYLNCSDKTVRKYVKEGRLEARKQNGKKGLEYRISKDSLERLTKGNFQSGNGRNIIMEETGYISYKVLYSRMEDWNKDLAYKLEQANYRIGQLETTRLMLTEQSENLQKNENEFREQIKEKDIEIEKNLIKLTEKEKIYKNYMKWLWGMILLSIILSGAFLFFSLKL